MHPSPLAPASLPRPARAAALLLAPLLALACAGPGRHAAVEPGSLKPTCPLRPIPSSCRSIPPAAAMAASHSRQAAAARSSGTDPSSTRARDGSMSTRSNRCRFISIRKLRGSSGAMGWNSSRLKLATWAKDSPASRWRRTSSA